MTRITIIDHDADLSELLTEVFELEGYESTIWSPAKGTFDALCQADADVILFESWCGAPETGWTLLRMLRRDPRTADTPIVLCSGDQAALEDNAEWIRAEGISTVPKPFDIDDLFGVVEGCVHDRRPVPALSG
jgi:DNA-binding NtrC family response regulator